MILRALFPAIILFFFLPQLSFSQKLEDIDSLKQELSIVTNDSLKLEILDKLVGNTSVLNRLDEMYHYLQLQQEMAMETQDTKGLVTAYFRQGQAYFLRSFKFDTALHFFYKGLDVLKQSEEYKDNPWIHMSAYNEIGLIYKNKEEYDSAIYYYDKVVDLSEATERSLVLNWRVKLNLSRLYNVLGNDSKALEYAFLCLEKAIENGPKSNTQSMIATSNRIIGEQFYSQKSFESAMQYFDKALEFSEKHAKEYESEINLIYSLKGSCFLHLGRTAEAKIYFEKYLQHLRSIYGDDHGKLVPSYSAMGKVYQSENDFSRASEYFLKTLAISEKFENRWHLDILKNLGRLELVTGKYEKALSYFSQALDYMKSHPVHNSGLYSSIANAHRLQGNLEASLQAYQKALMYTKDSNQQRTFNSLNKNWLNVKVLEESALVLEERFKKKHVMTDLEDALAAYQLSDSLITELRNLYKQKDDEIDFKELFAKVYSGGVRVSSKLHELTDEKQYLEEAFYFSEKAKAQILYESIARQENINYATLPDSLQNLEVELKSKIEFYQTKIQQQVLIKDTTKIRLYEDKLFVSKRAYANLLVNFEKEYPEYYKLNHDKSFIDVAGIQAKLSSDQTLIEYMLIDDSAFVFLVDRRNVQLVKMAVPEEFESSVEQFRASILDQRLGESIVLGKELYAFLFEPLEEKIKTTELIIIPEGILWHVNFDLLVKEEAEELPYLIADYAISYANSANLLFQERSVLQSSPIRGCLAFSYVDSVQEGQSMNFLALRDADADLPGTREEIKNIADLMPGMYYYGEHASEQNFKENGPDYSILHLALHGEIDDLDPNNSRLNFSKNQKDTLEDNYLYAFELYNMRLNADMAVLSACNTGAGQLANGEGIMSLGRAFQYAGVKSLLISNWEVLDDVAPEIMKSFYKYLKAGRSKSSALRQAKLDYLKTAELYRAAPYNWASFTIIGDASSIEMEEKSVFWWILIVIGGVAVFILVGRRRGSYSF